MMIKVLKVTAILCILIAIGDGATMVIPNTNEPLAAAILIGLMFIALILLVFSGMLESKKARRY